MGKVLLVLGGLLVVLFLFAACVGSAAVGAYNEAVKKQSDSLAAWAQVENQYQRRADLIPNLVEVVKGYASHERETLTAVTEARASVGRITLDPSKATPEDFERWQSAQGQLGAALSRLLFVTENYPNLKANENFIGLQAQLEGTENRISVERRRYNETVNVYNIYIRSFPNNVILGMVGGGQFSPMQLFKADEKASEAPKVDFGKSK